MADGMMERRRWRKIRMCRQRLRLLSKCKSMSACPVCRGLVIDPVSLLLRRRVSFVDSKKTLQECKDALDSEFQAEFITRACQGFSVL